MASYNKIYLASKSPRRRELISQVFKNIEFIDAPLNEPRWKKGQSPESYLKLCLSEKLRVGLQAVEQAEEGSFILVADTIVVLKGEVLGKPDNRQDATRMLEKLSDTWHMVPTAIRLALFREGEWTPLTRITESRVKFKKLNSKIIADYVRSGEPMDKAGAYGFQAKGLQLVEKIEGSYSNIIGLPVITLREMAQELQNG